MTPFTVWFLGYILPGIVFAELALYGTRFRQAEISRFSIWFLCTFLWPIILTVTFGTILLGKGE